MEAFLALTGHPVCSDPAAAHSNALLHDPRYKQQLAASMAAAQEQGWGAPMPVQPPAKRGKTPPAVASSSAGTSPNPSRVNTNSSNGAGGAWGRPAPAAAAAAAASSSTGAGGAWGRGPPVRAPAAAQQPQRQQQQVSPHQQANWKSTNPYLPNNPYEPTADTW